MLSLFVLTLAAHCAGSQIRHYPAISGTWVSSLEWTTSDPKFIQAARTDEDAMAKARFFARTMSLTFLEHEYVATVDFTALTEQERAEGQVPNRAISDSVKIVESSQSGGIWSFKIVSSKTGRIETKILRLLSEDHLVLEIPSGGPGDFPMHFKKR